MSEPLLVTSAVVLPAADLTWTATRAGGPGGQNVNKVSSRVELRFDLAGTTALDVFTKGRLRSIARGFLDAEGRILLKSQKTRDQAKNLADAREKLRELVLRALERPKPRRATKPSRAAKARRLDEKRHQGQKKATRRSGKDD